MVLSRTSQVVVLAVLLVAMPVFASRTHRAATSGHSHHHRPQHHFVPGQRQIEPQRATEIQDALIREHYLTGPASGQWDSTTEAAMQKFQADHGWQTRLTPDSRALIKLGLGPHDDAGPTAQASAAGAPIPAAASTSHGPAAGTLAAATTIQN